MSLARTIAPVRARAQAYWDARSAQERRFLAVGAAVVLAALAYLVLLEPALSGRAALRSGLPQLRQQAALVQDLAQQARSLAAAPAAPEAPFTREALASSLAARGMTAGTLALTGEYAKVQISNVSFANLSAWLDAVRREQRVTVQDATVTGLAAAGQVDATLTLRRAGPRP